MNLLKHRRLYFILLIDALLFLFFIAGVQHISEKAFIFSYTNSFTGDFRIKKLDRSVMQHELEIGDRVRTVNGQNTSSFDDLEFICDGLEIGEIVSLEVERNGIRETIVLPLVSYYGTRYVIIVLFVGCLYFFIGIFVLLKRPDDIAARIYHWISVSVAGIIMMTWGRYVIEPYGLGHVIRILFSAAYAFTPVFFVHFSMVFPQPKETPGTKSGTFFRWMEAQKMIRLQKTRQVFYVLAVAMTIWMGIQFLRATHPVSLDAFHQFYFSFFICRIFFMISIVFGIINFTHFYRSTVELSDRRQFRCAIAGTIIGSLGFMTWIIPNLLGVSPLFPEDFIILISAAAPISYAISIVRYHIMDIDLIINRSTVYAIALIILVATYISIVTIIAGFIGSQTSSMPLYFQIAAAVLVAILFDPARKRAQQFVDKQFFRVQYNFREAQRKFVHDIKRSLDIIHLAELLVARTDELLEVERIGFFYLRESNFRMRLLAHKNFDVLNQRSIRFQIEKLTLTLQLPIALDDRIEAGILHDLADGTVFQRWDIAIVFPMLSETLQILGFFVLGRKKSGARFYQEDVDLLSSITTQAGLAIERINLQVKYTLERAETERLQELNRLKSYFVSGVSHELKTPLTSIKMFAELLESSKNLPEETVSEYLHIIEGESERLSRLINNVLNFAKVERGVKEYHFGVVNLNRIVEDVVRSMEYQLKMHECAISIELASEEKIIRADADAVREALMNLISNAMKYSSGKREIIVTTSYQNESTAITVADKGIGISPDDLEKIFTPFFRARDQKAQQVGGTGLGLSLVRHIMDAHHGHIDVQSTPGEGSSFSLLFPCGDMNTA